MFKRIASLLLILLVASCGGSGDAGTSVFNPNPQPTAADLLIATTPTSLPNTASATVAVTITALDSSRNTLAGVKVTLSADNGAVLTGVSGAVTGTDGTVTASLGAGGDQSNRVITLSAVSGGVSKSATILVSGTKVSATLVPAVTAPGATGQVQYLVVDQAGKAMVNQAIQIAATGLTPATATGVTDAAGAYTYSYTAPSGAGSFQVSASVGGVTDLQTVSVQPVNTVPAVVGTIASASVSANPSVVAVNTTGSTTHQSVIRALFLGASNQPLANVRARFDLNGDPNSIGGTFAAGAGVLYSDVNGVVTTQFFPGTRSSPTDGVTVRVCYGVTDNDPGLVNCTNSKVVTLTVSGEPLSVAIGTNGLIIVKTLTYVKQYVVTVADAAGNPKADATVVASLDLLNYRKGDYTLPVGATRWQQNLRAVCANEDSNRNGTLDGGEDLNGDGQLWPRKSDVVVSFVNSAGAQVTSTTTGADGTAVLQIEYAQDHGSWVDALITVAASGVAGSEGRASYLVAPVPVDATALTKTDSAPAFVLSPYGVGSSCLLPN
ncbi:MAG: hypothetical protein ABI702_07575 [Burkholderiales bacterium]